MVFGNTSFFFILVAIKNIFVFSLYKIFILIFLLMCNLSPSMSLKLPHHQTSSLIHSHSNLSSLSISLFHSLIQYYTISAIHHSNYHSITDLSKKDKRDSCHASLLLSSPTPLMMVNRVVLGLGRVGGENESFRNFIYPWRKQYVCVFVYLWGKCIKHDNHN